MSASVAYAVSSLLLTIESVFRDRQSGGGGGLEEIQQDIRIPAWFSAVQLQSLLASDCMAVCSNSQGYDEPRGALATCGSSNHSFSCLTSSLHFFFCFVVQHCANPSTFFHMNSSHIFKYMKTNLCMIHSTPGLTSCRTPFMAYVC